MDEENRQEAVENNQSSNAEKIGTPSLIAAAFQREHPDWTTEIVEALGETTITVPREQIVSACGFMKLTPGFEFNFLADLCGFDRGPEEEPRLKLTITFSPPSNFIACGSRFCSMKITRTYRASRVSGGRPTGTSAKPLTCSASFLMTIRICVASF